MKKLLALLISAILCFGMMFTVVGCEDTPHEGSTGTSDTGSGETSDTGSGGTSDTGSEEGETVSVFAVSLPATIRSYISKAGEQENKETEFFVNSSNAEVTYKVGDDNSFRFKPEVSYVNEDYEDVAAPEDESFTATVTTMVEGVATDASAYYAYDAVASTFDFTEEAIGKVFKLNVRPNGLNAEQENDASYTISFEVEVVDGYNAYDEEELAYVGNFDTLNDLSKTHQHYGWKAFREEHGLTIDPNDINAVIMHDNMYLTKDVVPDSFFYNENNIPSDFADRAEFIVGSVREDRHHGLYTRWVEEGGRFDFLGNYFTLDAQQFPYVKIMDEPTNIVFNENGDITSSNVQSHFSIFRFEGQGRTTEGNPDTITNVSDLYAVGNSPKEDNLLYSGGLMLVKTERVEMEIENIISRCFFITCMNQVYGTCDITNMKCYDAFNAPLYNWGSLELNVDNCIIKGSGGPAVIVDSVVHTIGDIIPSVIMTDTVLDNPVYGSESWFVMAGATALLPQVVQLNAVPLGLYNGLASADSNFGGQLSGLLQQSYGVKYNKKGFAVTETKDGVTLNKMNIYCVIKNNNDELQSRMSAYVEVNGNVLDYGLGSAVENQKTNAPAGTTDADYRKALRTYVLGACRTYGAPLLESSGGGIVYFDGTNVNPAVSITGPADLQDPEKLTTLVNAVNFLNGDVVNIYYHNKVFGTLGIMFEYADLT